MALTGYSAESGKADSKGGRDIVVLQSCRGVVPITGRHLHEKHGADPWQRCNPTSAVASCGPLGQGEWSLVGPFEVACGFCDPFTLVSVPAGNLCSLGFDKPDQVIGALCRVGGSTGSSV